MTRLWKIQGIPFVMGIAVGSSLIGVYQGITSHWSKTNIQKQHTNIRTNSDGISHISEKYGLPQSANINLQSKYYTICYDRSKKIPSWALEIINENKLKGEGTRQNSHFRPDPRVKQQYQAQNDDYLGSGYSRGHMIPASHSKLNQEAMDETFYLSNIVPQDLKNNAGFWYRMELYCKNLAERYDNVFVISGPVFKPVSVGNGKKMMHYEVIGENNVAVPTHLFKVILTERYTKPACIGAFIVPNAPIEGDETLRQYEVPLQEVEKLTGLRIFYKLNTEHVSDLCIRDGCRLITKEKLEFINAFRMLSSSKSLDDLNSIWKVVGEKKVKVDERFMETYEKKKREFLQTN